MVKLPVVGGLLVWLAGAEYVGGRAAVVLFSVQVRTLMFEVQVLILCFACFAVESHYLGRMFWLSLVSECLVLE